MLSHLLLHLFYNRQLCHNQCKFCNWFPSNYVVLQIKFSKSLDYIDFIKKYIERYAGLPCIVNWTFSWTYLNETTHKPETFMINFSWERGGEESLSPQPNWGPGWKTFPYRNNQITVTELQGKKHVWWHQNQSTFFLCNQMKRKDSITFNTDLYVGLQPLTL